MDEFDSQRELSAEDGFFVHAKLNHLYNHVFEKGRFFQVLFSDSNEVHIKLAAQTLMKVVYITEKDDIEGVEIIKNVRGEDAQRVQFSKFNLQQLKCFLEFISSHDLKGISNRRISLAENSLDALDANTKKKIATLLSSDGGELVREFLDQGVISNQDIVNTGYRKQQLEVFKRMLYEDGLGEYKQTIQKADTKTKDETAWQHFFSENEWIFGYGLDYRFHVILQKEAHLSDTNAAGKNGAIADFLVGDSRFTTFVELKLPTTPLFEQKQNRANSWRLSDELFFACSQILEQKASGQLKVESKRLYDDSGKTITQRAYDPKSILVIGCWDEIQNNSDETRMIKEKTFELFRRDSRNIDIITYDELYERAKFIVEKPCKRPAL